MTPPIYYGYFHYNMLVCEHQKIDSYGWFISVSLVCDSPDVANAYAVRGQAGNRGAMQSHMETP